MKKKEIKQIYKAGMKVRCVYDNSINTLVSPDEFSAGYFWYKDSNGNTTAVYNYETNKLAEIIELPKAVEELPKAVEEVPEYVEMVKQGSPLAWHFGMVGIIFPVIEYYKKTDAIDEHYKVSESKSEYIHVKLIKPSTKQAYEAQQKQIKQDELLEEVKTRYPVGVTVRDADGDKITISADTIIDYGFIADESIFAKEHGLKVVLYLPPNRWAEIIKDIPEYTMEKAIELVGHEFTIKKS